jgi:hypothetical protein
MADITKSNRGKDILIIEGFTFYQSFTKADKTSIYWKCTEYRKFKCPGRCTTKNMDVIQHNNNHNHIPDNSDIKARKILVDMKKLATESQISTQNIIAKCVENVEQSVASKLPATILMKRTIQKTRKNTSGSPPEPMNLTQLIIPDHYQKTANGDKLLFYDSGLEEDRILIFTTDNFLNHLAQSNHWYADGTFKVVPKLFNQLFTIHALNYQTVIPTIYALMPNRRSEIYIKVLEAIKNLKPDLNPKSIMTDFELSSIKAFNNSFPRAANKGCFFHFTQSIWRKIQQNNDLCKRYKEDSEFASNLKQLTALAFVPVADVIISFVTLTDTEFFSKESQLIDEFVAYFEATYIGLLKQHISDACIAIVDVNHCLLSLFGIVMTA